MNYALKYPRFWFWYFWASLALLAVSYGATALSAFAGKGQGQVAGLWAHWSNSWVGRGVLFWLVRPTLPEL